MKKNPLNTRAIVTGFVSDLAATHLFLIAVLIVLYNPGSASVCLADRIADPLPLNLFLLICGIALTGIGGFVTGRLARTEVVRNAMAMGCMSLMASLFMGHFDLSPLSLLGYFLTIPVAAFGGMCSTFFPPTERS